MTTIVVTAAVTFAATVLLWIIAVCVNVWWVMVKVQREYKDNAVDSDGAGTLRGGPSECPLDRLAEYQVPVSR